MHKEISAFFIKRRKKSGKSRGFLRLFAQFQLDRAMVGAQDVGMDPGIGKAVAQTVGDDEIIDAPASILLTGLEAI